MEAYYIVYTAEREEPLEISQQDTHKTQERGNINPWFYQVPRVKGFRNLLLSQGLTGA